MPNIYWIDLNRFDENISKAPRLEIAEALINENFSVTLLTGFRKEKYIPKSYNLKIKYFRSLNLKGCFKVSLHLAIFFWLLKNTVEDDIVFLSPGDLWMSIPLKKIKKCKIHLDFRTLPVEVNTGKNKLGHFLYWSLSLKTFIRQPDSFSFITELLKKSVEEEFKVTFNDYAYWQSAANINRFEIVRKTPAVSGDIFKLTYLGVITRSRGIDLVLRAIAKIHNEYQKNILFQIIGAGSFLPELKKLSTDLGINDRVIFEGYVPYESVPEKLKNTDCFICPLPERPEWNVSSPIKIFEYLACARPVILTPIIAHTNILNGEKFVVWTKDDSVQEFKNAIEFAFLNKNRLLADSETAPEYVRDKFGWEKQGQKLSRHLKQLLAA